MKRWSNLRDAFKKARKKEKDAIRTGTWTAQKRKYIYHDQLQFLVKDSDQHPTSYLPEMLPVEDCVGSDDEVKKPRKEHLSKKHKLDPVDSKITRAADERPADPKISKVLEERPDRHLSFFKGILPSLNNFDDNEILEFQIGVLQLVSGIRQKKQYTSPSHTAGQFQLSSPASASVPLITNVISQANQNSMKYRKYNELTNDEMGSEPTPEIVYCPSMEQDEDDVSVRTTVEPLELKPTLQKSFESDDSDSYQNNAYLKQLQLDSEHLKRKLMLQEHEEKMKLLQLQYNNKLLKSEILKEKRENVPPQ